MLRCREYIRVSSRKQIRGASLDDQRAANAGRARPNPAGARRWPD